MNRTFSILCILFIPLQFHAQVNTDWEVFYQPPSLPISVSWGTNGLKVKFNPSVNTLFGTFGVAVSGSMKKEDEETFTHQGPEKIYIQVPKIITKEKIVEKPIIKIKTVEKIKIVENNVFIVELRNYEKGKSQEFIIKGLDVFDIEVDGQTRINAREGRIIIDVLNSRVTSLQFKGNQLNPEDKTDLIVKACRKLNENHNYYGYYRGFLISPLNYELTEKDKQKDKGFQNKIIQNAKERANRLISYYKVQDFHDKPLAITGSLLITENGIGLPLKTKGLFGKPSKKTQYQFFKWNEFLSLNFKWTSNKLIIKKQYDNYEYYLSTSNNFSETQYLRLFNRIVEIITQ